MGISYKFLGFVVLGLFPGAIYAHDVTEADRSLLAGGGLWDYVWVGAKHMLTGYDHLLFLVGVVFFLRVFKDILRFITAFTIGHSITLLGATYLEVQVNEHLIDAIIGLSVFYKGFENLGGFDKILQIKAPNLIRMVFLFGLIHGLGLSARLQSFTIAQERSFLKILSFNLGVEIGQIIALVPIVMVINYFRSKANFEPFYKAVNSYLLLAGIMLALIQFI